MTISIVLAFASVVFSESVCYAGSPADASFVKWLLVCLRVTLYEEIPGNEFAPHLYLQTKYLLLVSVSLFLLGMLWCKGVLGVPSGVFSAAPRNKNASGMGE